MYEDFDKEIEDLKEREQRKLDQEKDTSLGLKGENGIMKKKFSQLRKDIQDKIEEKQEVRGADGSRCVSDLVCHLWSPSGAHWTSPGTHSTSRSTR